MRRAVWLVVLVAGLEPAPFPYEYRGWFHVKSMVIEEGHPLFAAFGGIHHVYANAEAYRALRDPKMNRFPVGSVLVFDLLEARREKGALVEGKRKVLAIMRKVRGAEETGGWIFQAFAGGDPRKPIVKDPVKECFQCHTGAGTRDFVFSAWRP